MHRLNSNMTKTTLKYIFAIILMIATACIARAQKILSVHKAEKQETVFGIAKQYGVTIDELKNSNPAMREEGFVLKKGMLINIPEHNEKAYPLTKAASAATGKTSTATNNTSATAATASATSSQHITLGVMLPLHDINGDGKRMVEYYRGVLLAVNELKKQNIDVTVNAWNLAEGDDAHTALEDGRAGQCDAIFGPLYTTQVRTLSSYCMEHNIRLVIPFSINATDVQTCPQVYQVYQTPADITANSITQFVARFSTYHPVFIDCNDQTSKKGDFTFGLRKVLEEKGIQYSITNLNNSPEQFAKAFSTSKRNMVVLNTGRSPELGQALKKLEELIADKTHNYGISMFGYNEWFMYTKIYDQKFRRFDAYIPSVYDYNAESERVKSIEKLYTDYYNTAPMQSLPSFFITGYDQTMFFVHGILKYGKAFHGTTAQQPYTAIQSPYQFERLGNGGYQNRTFMLVHYK